MKFKLCLLLLIASNLHSTDEETIRERLKRLPEHSAVLLVTLCGKRVVPKTEFPHNLYNIRQSTETLMSQGFLWNEKTVKSWVKVIIAQHLRIHQTLDSLLNIMTTVSFDEEQHPLHVLLFLHDTGDKVATKALSYLWQRAKQSKIVPLVSEEVKDLLTACKVNIDNPGGSVNKVFIIGKGSKYQVTLEK